jgi:predicted tellurium resistance membrane protein TerC
VAAAAKGNIPLLIFGLGLSIPIILCCSAVIAKLMNKYAWLVIAGGAILGKVAGEMIVTDPLVHARLGSFAHATEWIAMIGLTIGIPVVARWKDTMALLGGRRAEEAVKPAAK